MNSVCLRYQNAVADQLKRVPLLVNVAVLVEDLRDATSMARLAMLPRVDEAGKDQGIAIVVLFPLGNATDPLGAGGIDEVKLIVRVIEDPMVHAGRGNPGHPVAMEAAEATVGALAQFKPPGEDYLIAPEYPTIRLGNDPYAVGSGFANWLRWAKTTRPLGDVEGSVALDCHFRTLGATNPTWGLVRMETI